MNDIESKRVKVMNLIAEYTGGRSYKAHKYSLYNSDRPSVDYGNNDIVWKRRAETTPHKTYVDLRSLIQKNPDEKSTSISFFSKRKCRLRILRPLF